MKQLNLDFEFRRGVPRCLYRLLYTLAFCLALPNASFSKRWFQPSLISIQTLKPFQGIRFSEGKKTNITLINVGKEPKNTTSTPTSTLTSTKRRSPSIQHEGEQKMNEMPVQREDDTFETLDEQKLLRHLDELCVGLDTRHVNTKEVATKTLRGSCPNMTSAELSVLASETASSLSTQHPDYASLAARICITAAHKKTNPSFSETMLQVHEDEKGCISESIADLLRRRGNEIDRRIRHQRDFDLSYFGYKTLERSYLLKNMETGELLERPQYMLMRVALGIHYPNSSKGEDTALANAFETYEYMSQGYFINASPALFHAGTAHPQLCSCFLVQMSDDSIHGIYETLTRCAKISRFAGGIGLCVHNIRARGSNIKGTRGVSNGLVPMLRLFDVASRHVDQGGGKRPGAFAIYLEPWHADILDVLNLKKNHGKEEQRARDLFYGLWIPDLFMKRVEEDGMWSLMCPNSCPGLQHCHGKKFEKLYTRYEKEGHVVRTIRARELWGAILDAQIETGAPYMHYKDACNAKSNQRNLGTIQCSNLCAEIIQYTDSEQVAVCNLANLCLAKFVVSNRGQYGSVDLLDSPTSKAYFDHDALHEATKVVTRNLNRIIDINHYPLDGAKKSNLSHRPIGIGVSGLADTFLRLGLPFTSEAARKLNEAIFETIYHGAVEASTELAEEQGHYNSYDGSPISNGLFQFNLWGDSENNLPSVRYSKEVTQRQVPQYYPSIAQENGFNWQKLRERIKKSGVRNSLLVAPMPTASTSQILGVNECFEPFVSNLYLRRVTAGEFIMANPHLLQDLSDRCLWNSKVRNQLMRDGGSVQNISCIPDRLKELYKTVWELKMKDIIDMAADRGRFIDQSQSLNLFLSDPTVEKLTAMHFHAWKRGLKTGMYYLRSRPAVHAIKYTVENAEAGATDDANFLTPEHDELCLSCQV